MPEGRSHPAVYNMRPLLLFIPATNDSPDLSLNHTPPISRIFSPPARSQASYPHASHNPKTPLLSESSTSAPAQAASPCYSTTS